MRTTVPSTSAARHIVATVLAVFVALFLTASAGVVVAQPPDESEQEEPDRSSTVTWGISPAGADRRDTRSIIDHLVDPGSTLVDHVVIDNFGTEPLALDLYASDARPANGAFDLTAAEEIAETIGAWVELDGTAIEIPARDHVIVAVTIAVPENAEPGDYAGGILASRRTMGVGNDVGLETERRVGTRVHLRVAGPIEPALVVTDLQASYASRVNPVGSSGVDVEYRIRNTGNVRLSGDTTVTVRGPFGWRQRTTVAPPLDDLLPGHWVHQHLTVQGNLPLGRLYVEVEMVPSHSIDQSLDGSVEPVRATTTTAAVPYTALLLLVALVVAVWAIRRRRRGRRARLTDGSDADRPDAPGTDPDATNGDTTGRDEADATPGQPLSIDEPVGGDGR